MRQSTFAVDVRRLLYANAKIFLVRDMFIVAAAVVVVVVVAVVVIVMAVLLLLPLKECTGSSSMSAEVADKPRTLTKALLQ